MNISKPLIAVFFAAGLMSATNAYADDRELIKIPDEAQKALLTEMRSLLENLNELLGAVAEGDFKEVARISDFKLGFGHARWQRMKEAGYSQADIQAQIDRMQAMRAANGGKLSEEQIHGKGMGMGQGKGMGMGMGMGRGMGGGGGDSIFGRGVGRFMPDEVRALGQQLHGSAAVISVAAKKAGSKPIVEDYKTVIGGIEEMTAVCAACHASYKIR